MGAVNHALQIEVDQPRRVFDRNISEEAKGAHPDIVDPSLLSLSRSRPTENFWPSIHASR